MKPSYLLDINVLLALAWPNHQFHLKAHYWFKRHKQNGWASCAITQLGFIRLSSNPAFTNHAVMPGEARTLLGRIVKIPGHHYLSENLAPQSLHTDAFERLLGHKQVTDAYLLALARKHSVLFTTFDKRISALAKQKEIFYIEP